MCVTFILFRRCRQNSAKPCFMAHFIYIAELPLHSIYGSVSRFRLTTPNYPPPPLSSRLAPHIASPLSPLPPPPPPLPPPSKATMGSSLATQSTRRGSNCPNSLSLSFSYKNSLRPKELSDKLPFRILLPPGASSPGAGHQVGKRRVETQTSGRRLGGGVGVGVRGWEEKRGAQRFSFN